MTLQRLLPQPYSDSGRKMLGLRRYVPTACARYQSDLGVVCRLRQYILCSLTYQGALAAAPCLRHIKTSALRDSDNIRYDLLRTGNVATTTNTILERGFLPAVSLPASIHASHVTHTPQPPPAYYTLYPRALDSNAAPNNRPAPAPTPSSATKPKPETLIARYHLEDRVTSSSGVEVRTPEEVAGRAVWEDSAEKREASLRERKAQMVLAARQCVRLPIPLTCD